MSPAPPMLPLEDEIIHYLEFGVAELSEAHVSVNFSLIQNKISCNEDCIALLLYIGFFMIWVLKNFLYKNIMQSVLPNSSYHIGARFMIIDS